MLRLRVRGGPGELSMPTHLVLWSNQLVIPDAMNRRVNLFGTDGKFVDSRPIDPMAGFPIMWGLLADRVIYLLQPLPVPLPGQPASSEGYTLHVIRGARDS